MRAAQYLKLCLSKWENCPVRPCCGGLRHSTETFQLLAGGLESEWGLLRSSPGGLPAWDSRHSLWAFVSDQERHIPLCTMGSQRRPGAGAARPTQGPALWAHSPNVRVLTLPWRSRDFSQIHWPCKHFPAFSHAFQLPPKPRVQSIITIAQDPTSGVPSGLLFTTAPGPLWLICFCFEQLKQSSQTGTWKLTHGL